MQEPRSILVPIVAGIGNALMALPMVQRLKEALPQCRLTIAARTSAMAEPFRRLVGVDEVLLLGRGLHAAVQLLRLRKRHFDVCLVPFPSNRWQYVVMAIAGGAAQRVLHSYPVGFISALGFLPARRLAAVRGIHDCLQNLNLLTQLGIANPQPLAPRFVLRDSDRRAATSLLQSIGIGPEVRPITIHPGSARTILAQAKRWPPECYASLFERLESEYGPRIIFLEGPDEAGLCSDILAHAAMTASPGMLADGRGGTPDPRPPTPDSRILPLTGSLAIAAAILERAEFYVGSDSGLAHLAASVGTPAVTLFAPADPDRVCPYGCRDLVVQPRGKTCSPCFLYPWSSTSPKMRCRPPYCIGDVSVDDVVQAARRAAARRAVVISGQRPVATGVS